METVAANSTKAESFLLLSLSWISIVLIVKTIPSLILYPLPPSLFPKASSVAALHLHVQNFVTQYTHIHLTTTTTSITSQTPFHSPQQCALRCQRFCVMFSTTSLLHKRTKLQFMLNSSYNTPSLKISYSNPLSLARTQQFSWARTQFASALKQALLLPPTYRDVELVSVHALKSTIFYLESMTCICRSTPLEIMWIYF